MSKPIYRFTVFINSVLTEVYPRPDGDLEKVYEPQAGEMFFREKLNGPMIFVRNDFDLLNAITLDDTCFFAIEEFGAGGIGTWTLFFAGYWQRTDMDIDEDNRTIRVEPLPDDRYEDILGAMDREFNLPQMDIPLTKLRYVRAPLVQVYVAGSNFLTNYIGGTHWEQEVTPVANFLTLTNDYKFAATDNVMFIPGDASVLDPDVSGEYNYNGSGNNYNRVDGAYQIRLDPTVGGGNIRWEIVALPSETVVYRKPTNAALVLAQSFEPPPSTFTSLTSGDECHVFLVTLYSRVLCNGATFDGNATFDTPDPDIVPLNENYSKVYPLELNTYLGATGHQVEPTRWGQFDEDDLHYPEEYFVKPSPPVAGAKLYPVSNTDWKAFSVWLYIDSAVQAMLEAEAEELLLKHAYKLPDILTAILAEIAPGVTHEEAAGFSDFFYGASNPVRGARKYPIFAPKTNVKAGEYDRPATKAIIKLGEILRFLRDFYQAYWWINPDGEFCLEHVRYFRNGLHYTTPNVGADLTTEIEPKTAKVWSYRSRRYTYDKPNLPRQIRWKWMDKQSPPFEGFPLEMVSPYVQKGNFTENILSQFSADLEFIQAQPGVISDDGFVFFEALLSEVTGYYTPFVEQAGGPGEEFTLQNGYASLLYGVSQYWRDNLPCEDITLNDEPGQTAASVQRSKVQEIDYPGGGAIINPMELIRTMLGDGRARAMSVNVFSKAHKIKIEHDIP